jgi:hypothetical protein
LAAKEMLDGHVDGLTSVDAARAASSASTGGAPVRIGDRGSRGTAPTGAQTPRGRPASRQRPGVRPDRGRPAAGRNGGFVDRAGSQRRGRKLAGFRPSRRCPSRQRRAANAGSPAGGIRAAARATLQGLADGDRSGLGTDPDSCSSPRSDSASSGRARGAVSLKPRSPPLSQRGSTSPTRTNLRLVGLVIQV